jgi:plastocyanin
LLQKQIVACGALRPAFGHAKKASMVFNDAMKRVRRLFAVLSAAAVVIAAGTLIGLALPPYAISQKGRQFHPGEISIKRGETLQILNDDFDLLHHAYVDSPKFSFDSGDQQPGTRTDITFTAAGDFEVLCAIHPKMRLVVHVN